MAAWLRPQGHLLNPKRVRRRLRLMGLEALDPKASLSTPGPMVQRYPALLRDRSICQVNAVWGTHITYLRRQRGFLYLVAVLDWYSRYVRAWEMSNTLDTRCCLPALEAALRQGRPRIVNTDQGAQFTSQV